MFGQVVARGLVVRESGCWFSVLCSRLVLGYPGVVIQDLCYRSLVLRDVAKGLLLGFLRCGLAESKTPAQPGCLQRSITGLQFHSRCGQVDGRRRVRLGRLLSSNSLRLQGGLADPTAKTIFTRAGFICRIAKVAVDVLVWLARDEIVRWRLISRVESNMWIDGANVNRRVGGQLVIGLVVEFASGASSQKSLNQRDVPFARGLVRISQRLGSSSRCGVLLWFWW